MGVESLEKKPLVSIIMPTYNGAHFLQDALFSVLQQNYGNIEVFVCDDASKDGTLDIVHKIKDEYDHQSQIHTIEQQHNQWISKNMNTWLEAATGKYIAILDQDDFRRDPNKLEKQVNFLEQNKDHGIVWTNVIFNTYWVEISRNYPSLDKSIRDMILWGCPMLHSSVMYNKDLAKQIGGYSESYRYAMDYKLFLDLMKQAKWANIKDFTTHYRRHGNNTSILKAKEQQIEAKTIRKDNKHNFPNRTKNIICMQTVWLLNTVFWEYPLYQKVKAEAKKIYFK